MLKRVLVLSGKIDIASCPFILSFVTPPTCPLTAVVLLEREVDLPNDMSTTSFAKFPHVADSMKMNSLTYPPPCRSHPLPNRQWYNRPISKNKWSAAGLAGPHRQRFLFTLHRVDSRASRSIIIPVEYRVDSGVHHDHETYGYMLRVRI